MRCVQNPQMALGQIPIADIQFDASSRNDIPAVLRGLQHLYCDDDLLQQVFDLLEQQLLQRPRTDADQDAAPTARINPDVGRPGLQLWQVVVLAVLKQGLTCDCDRLAELATAGVEEAEQEEIERWLGHAELLIDQIDRRVLQGQTIPPREKVFSLFEPHTRWCVKGNAGVPVELGVPVSVVECAQQFVLHWQLMWEQQDVDVAAELVERTQRLYPSLEECSFDKGYHSPANREALDRLLQQNVLPRKGRLTKADREREGAPPREGRKPHPRGLAGARRGGGVPAGRKRRRGSWEPDEMLSERGTIGPESR